MIADTALCDANLHIAWKRCSDAGRLNLYHGHALLQALFSVPDEAAEGGPAIPDILDQASLWAAAGVSFGSTETYRIYLAVKKLAETLPAGHEALRLWGRVTCRNGQYLVVEGKALDEELGEFEETKMEVKNNDI
jgi:radial spoke head protein 4/6